MSKSLEERFDREFLKILKEMYPSIPMDKAHSQDLIDFIQKEINSSLAQQAKDHEILVNTILDTKKEELAQYKREIRNKIEKKKQYHLSTSYRCKNDRTYGEEGKFCVECGKKITEKEELKWESLGEEGFNKAIDDVLAELDKLNHTDKKEGGK